MREIKFRGKTLSDDHKWLYGNLNLNDDGKAAIMRIGDFWSLQPVNPDTVGQFTGLKDCKGQEIFEGDILFVKAENPYWSKFDSKHVVTWCNDGWILNDYGTDDPELFHILMNNNCEIIGNVHDSPELLEGKDA